MYDISAFSATRVYDGNLKDLFSGEALAVKKNNHGTYQLSVYYCEFLNLFGLKRVGFIELWKISVTLSALDNSLKCKKYIYMWQEYTVGWYIALCHSPDNSDSNDGFVCSMLCFFWEFGIHNLAVTFVLFGISTRKPARCRFLIFVSWQKGINAVLKGVRGIL